MALRNVVYCIHNKENQRICSGRRPAFGYIRHAKKHTVESEGEKVVPYVPLDSVRFLINGLTKEDYKEEDLKKYFGIPVDKLE